MISQSNYHKILHHSDHLAEILTASMRRSQASVVIPVSVDDSIRPCMVFDADFTMPDMHKHKGYPVPNTIYDISNPSMF